MTNSIIRFEAHDSNRFALLARVFEALQRAKQSSAFPDDSYWKDFFDQEALSYFWYPAEQELRDFIQQWDATPVAQRFSDPTLRRPWHFGSMLEALKDGEYELLTCKQTGHMGQLEFRALAWPHGGTSALRALIEAFGFRVTDEIE